MSSIRQHHRTGPAGPASLLGAELARARVGAQERARGPESTKFGSNVRTAVAHLTRSRTLLFALAGAVVLAVAAAGVGYAAMSKTVTLSIDGKTKQVRTFGGHVSDVLHSAGMVMP